MIFPNTKLSPDRTFSGSATLSAPVLSVPVEDELPHPSSLLLWSGERASPAKLNLTLRIVGRVSNGFHLLRSLIVPLTFGDTVSISLSRGTGQIACECFLSEDLQNNLGENLGGEDEGDRLSEVLSVLNSEKNLAWRAAREFLNHVSLREEIDLKIQIKKRIPFEAGLGGGSSNAASVLLLLAEAFAKIEPAKSKPNLIFELAPSLGSDVSCFLKSGPSFIHGCGESVCQVLLEEEPLPEQLTSIGLVILKPRLGVKTALAYQLYDEHHGLLEPIFNDAIDEEIASLRQNLLPGFNGLKKNVKTFSFLLGTGEWFREFVINDFESVIFESFPELKDLRNILYQQGAEHVLLAGSGSALVGFTKTTQGAKQLEVKLRTLLPKEVFLTTSSLRW